MYKVRERIILDRLIKHREETTRDKQAGFCPGRSTIDQVFTVRRMIEIWERYSKPLQLNFWTSKLPSILLTDAAWSSMKMNGIKRRTIAAVRYLAGCTTVFESESVMRQGAKAGPFRFSSSRPSSQRALRR
ncbi:hypothetical protein RB195_006871 [Necator americanus]|uniref:Reverse transcriptase domain-containing protein n=1 Tax=Necator americanus TaxID=51031 RepID=A0ABR1BVZ1_NECAM